MDIPPAHEEKKADSSNSDRFDPTALDGEDMINLFVDDDNMDYLDPFWNKDAVTKIHRDYCYLCKDKVSNFGKAHHCHYCGETVCKQCR